MQIHPETLERVRDRAQILDQFEQSQLKKSGREFLATCPWHDDRRPSLTVSPKTNRAYCFVCAKGVDSIGWIQETQGLSFSESVLRLADRYNIPVEAATEEETQRLTQEREERSSLLAQREKQTADFASEIWLSPGLAYLHQRGLTNETIKAWQLGWNGRRVMFPLRDPQGRTVAFTGRALDDSKPKYKNSQNDLLYQKSQMVFGLDLARPEIIKSGIAVICEGQMDVISCWQEGVKNMVAVSGSALTAQMVQQLINTTRVKEIVCCFDGDAGGFKAAQRARVELMNLALKGGVRVKILSLPAGKDPADLADQMAELIKSAPNWVEWWLETEFSELDLNRADDVIKGEAVSRQILKVLPSGALREYVKEQCKKRLSAVPNVPAAVVRTNKQIDQCRWAERRAVRLYLIHSGSRPALQDFSFNDPWIVKAQQLISAIEAMAPGRPEVVKPAFERAVSMASAEEQSQLMPLVYPIPEVRRVIEANPVGELEAAMSVLSSDQCAS